MGNHDGERRKEALDSLLAEESDHDPLPDLVLLDWNLPKVSGNEVLMRLKEHERLRQIPVLIFSSPGRDADIHAAYGNQHAANIRMEIAGLGLPTFPLTGRM